MYFSGAEVCGLVFACLFVGVAPTKRHANARPQTSAEGAQPKGFHATYHIRVHTAHSAVA